MAAIAPAPYTTSQVPATPIKGFSVNTSEINAPEYSPGAAPVYNKDVNADSTVFDGTNPSMIQPGKDHPILPIGNIVYDIRNHLSCHKNFNMNIETLMFHFLNMKKDLDDARKAQAQAERDLLKEREEKEGWKSQAEIYRLALQEAQEELAIVRDELTATEQRLSLAIAQLTEAARKLELTRNDLRLRTRERDELARALAETKRQLEFQIARATELQAALDIANAGENAANDRNTRLTELLYQIEASKAAIERSKDSSEIRVRELLLLVEQLKQGGDRPQLEATILKLRMEVQRMEIIIRNRESERDDARNIIINKDREISELNLILDSRKGDIDSLKAYQKFLTKLVKSYERIAKRLPHRYCREQFPADSILAESLTCGEEVESLTEHFHHVFETPVPATEATEGGAAEATKSVEPVAGEASTAAKAEEEKTAEDETAPTNSDA